MIKPFTCGFIWLFLCSWAHSKWHCVLLLFLFICMMIYNSVPWNDLFRKGCSFCFYCQIGHALSKKRVEYITAEDNPQRPRITLVRSSNDANKDYAWCVDQHGFLVKYIGLSKEEHAEGQDHEGSFQTAFENTLDSHCIVRLVKRLPEIDSWIEPIVPWVECVHPFNSCTEFFKIWTDYQVVSFTIKNWTVVISMAFVFAVFTVSYQLYSNFFIFLWGYVTPWIEGWTPQAATWPAKSVECKLVYWVIVWLKSNSLVFTCVVLYNLISWCVIFKMLVTTAQQSLLFFKIIEPRRNTTLYEEALKR